VLRRSTITCLLADPGQPGRTSGETRPARTVPGSGQYSWRRAQRTSPLVGMPCHLRCPFSIVVLGEGSGDRAYHVRSCGSGHRPESEDESLLGLFDDPDTQHCAHRQDYDKKAVYDHFALTSSIPQCPSMAGGVGAVSPPKSPRPPRP
jgi:hypothetical protein